VEPDGTALVRRAGATREAIPTGRSGDGADAAVARIVELFEPCLRHDGHAGFRVEMRILKRRQKEIIVDCGRQYRFVLDFDPESDPRT